MPTNALGSTALGLYAPAGEVVTLQFSSKTLSLMKAQNINNFQIIINESYWDNTSAGDIKDPGTVSNRYPFVKTNFNVDLKTLEKTGGSFQFGSPFGGTISIRTNKRIAKSSNNAFYQAYDSYNFSVTGAVEMLSYMHNVTTEQDWNDQIARVKTGEISAPAMAIDFPLGTANFAVINEKNKFAGVALEDLVYPKQVVDKWTSFMFISEFLASRDKSGKLIKLTLRFCDDMWIQNAIAIAGGDETALPVRWAGSAFLLGLETWNKLSDNWGIFHEVNHNFQQNNALFAKRSHGETNQVTMLVQSFLSDNGRFKNLWNPLGEFSSGGWAQRLSSAYNAIQFINSTTNVPSDADHELPTILAYQFGSLNMLKYIRNDVYNAPNTAAGWNGFKEIIQLSDAFKINLWPAMDKFKVWWFDGWDKTPPQEIQKELDRINASYKKVDFVGNLFATGSYIYDQTSDDYLYTNDTSAPIEVAANVPYVFDFGKGINSFRNSVTWEELIFNDTTKLGGKLVQNPSNTKQLIYIPPTNIYNQIDEFDIAIKPITNENNYVDQYKWKVKMNLTSNLPLVTMYNDPVARNNNKDFIKDWEYMKNPDNFIFQAPVDPRVGIYADQAYNTKQWQKAKISFNFIAPENGEFSFKIKGDSWLFIDVDENHKLDPNQIWWKATDVPVRNFIDTSVLQLKKGEAVKFDVYLTQRRLQNKLQMLATTNGNTYDVFDHVTTPVGDVSEELLGFNYVPRYADQDLFQSNLLAPHQGTAVKMIDKKDYTFYDAKGSSSIDSLLAANDSSNWETWVNGPLTLNFRVDFNSPQQIGSIIFNHRNDNWWEARATKMIIKDQDDNLLYDGRYGLQFDDRNKSASIFNFEQPLTNIKQLKFTLINEKIISKGQSAISLNAIQFNKDSYYRANQVLSMQDPAIKYYGPNWEVKFNDRDVNVSGFNSAYVTTNGKYEKFETTIMATGFDIIGQKGPDLGEFDLYVNDQLIGSYNLNQSIRADQQLLASYRATDWKNSNQLRIKLVNKSNKPIRFDAIQTYGAKVIIN